MSKKKGAAPAPLKVSFGLYLLTLLVVLSSALILWRGQWQTEALAAWESWLPLGVYLLAVPLLLLWLALIKWRGDAGLLGTTLLLCGIGVVIQFRMGSLSATLEKPANLLPLSLGLVAFALGATITNRGRGTWLASARWPAYLASLAIFGAMLLLGRSYRGGIYLPGNINPSEIVKPLLVLFLAAYLSRRQKAFAETQIGIPTPPMPTLAGLCLLWGIPMLATILVKDLGLMVLLNAILIIMLFAIARATGYLAVGLALVTAAGYAIQLISSHARARFDVWLNPYTDPTGKGWQILQALAAMYSGGLWGTGLGAGTPQSVPIVTSDFVYAAIAEEFGLVGCALILLLYANFFTRALRTAETTRTPFERLLAIGLSASLATQTIFNLAGVTKALPMTGITLPFISHGGSSLVTSLLIAGLLTGLSSGGQRATPRSKA